MMNDGKRQGFSFSLQLKLIPQAAKRLKVRNAHLLCNTPKMFCSVLIG